MIEKKDLVVGEHHWRSVQFDKEGEILDMIKASLPFWKRIKQTLDGLGVKKELSIIDMTDDDFEWLRWLDNLFNKNHVVLSKKEQKTISANKKSRILNYFFRLRKFVMESIAWEMPLRIKMSSDCH